MWEQLKTAPIVPFVIVDAFDLFPAGYWVNPTGGVVTVVYLPAIDASEAVDRDHMLRIVNPFH